MINAVNLSITNLCTSDCIYCPKDRGACCTVSTMSVETFDALMANLVQASDGLGDPIKTFRLGENGDLFINKHAIYFFRTIRSTFPRATIELYNHFRILAPHISDILLDEKLVDAVFMNIDGLGQTFEATKKTSFPITMDNFLYFINKRNTLNLNIPISIRTLTLTQYADVVYSHYGVLPAQVRQPVPDETDGFQAVRNTCRKLLKKGDSLKRSWPILWAEREQLKNIPIHENKYSCPMLARIMSEIFVSPEGKCYLCCLDSRQELLIGDLTTTTLQDVLASPQRLLYINNLRNRRFSAIDGPCRTIHCCQLYHKNRLVNASIRFFTRYQFITNKIFKFLHDENHTG